MIKIYRKIGGNNGSSLLSIGAGASQGEGTDGLEIKKVKLNVADAPMYTTTLFSNLIDDGYAQTNDLIGQIKNIFLMSPYVMTISDNNPIDVYTQRIVDLKIGDSIKGLTKNIQSTDLFSNEDLGLWPENKVMVYKIKDGNLLLFSMNYYPFGVITKNNGENIFLVDFNGDSILDCQPEMLFVPPWIVDLNSKGGDSGNVLRSLFKEKLAAYNGNVIPSESPEMMIFAKRLVEIAKDINAEDRIFLYFDFLHDVLYKRKEYLIDKACLANIEAIASKTKEARSVWLIQAIELAYKDDDIELCRKYNNELILINNSFVPGLYYQYLLENNLEKKEVIRKNLLSKYSNHWMIQDRFYHKK